MATSPNEPLGLGTADGHKLGASDLSADQYDARYRDTQRWPIPYRRSEPEWASMSGAIAEHLIRAFRLSRVLDMGCALGFLVKAFWDRGVQAWGRDISEFAIANVRADVQYCAIGSVTDPIDNDTFDLIICIDVLEHVAETDALSAIANMAKATDIIVFSSPPSLIEPTQVNVRSLVWRLPAFDRCGFNPDILFDAGFIASHAIIFRRGSQPLNRDVNQLFADVLGLQHEIEERRGRLKHHHDLVYQ